MEPSMAAGKSKIILPRSRPFSKTPSRPSCAGLSPSQALAAPTRASMPSARLPTFSYEPPLDLFRTHGSLNGLLPPDIRVLEVQTAPDDFHARYSAKSKIYHYHLHLDRVMSPFLRLYRHHVHFPIDLEELRAAAQMFIGTHDFSAFANEAAAGAAAKNPIRTLARLDIVPQEGGLRLEFEGDSFLYKMVRNITGTLLDVCRGKIRREQIPEIFASKDRRMAGPAAPPQGLFLVKIDYVE